MILDLTATQHEQQQWKIISKRKEVIRNQFRLITKEYFEINSEENFFLQKLKKKNRRLKKS